MQPNEVLLAIKLNYFISFILDFISLLQNRRDWYQHKPVKELQHKVLKLAGKRAKLHLCLKVNKMPCIDAVHK